MATLTRKHFIAIAEALRTTRPNGDADEPLQALLVRQWHADRERIATVLRNENGAFDRYRFYAWTEK